VPGQLTPSQQGCLSAELDPAPILAAAEAYRGSIVDLDRSITVGPQAFARQWTKLGEQMAACGLQPGDRLVLAVANGPLFPAALAAALAQGGTPLLLHGETPWPEMQRAAMRIGAKFILCDRLHEQANEAAQFAPRLIGHGPWAEALWADLRRAGVPPAFGAAGETPALQSLPGVPLHPTSGTTGQPKVAARGGFSAMEEARHYVETLAIDEQDTVLALPPMSHAYAYGMCAMVPLLTGANIVTMRRFSPEAVCRAMAEHDITIFPAAPMMLDMLLVAGGPLSGLPRCILSAGSPLSERTAREFQRRSGTVVRPLYGSTETGGISIATGVEASEAGCVGCPMASVSVELRPPAYGAHWGDGVGEVYVRSSSMMAGYLTPHGLEGVSETGGWHATGDLGRADRSGAIHLKGRQTDVINVCGMKVVPSEVEAVISALAGVAEVKVYAGRRRNATQFVKAAIVAPGLDPARIRAHCEGHLVYYKRPESIALLPALPKSPAGKVLKDQLP
jgi:long-chain acyl-CoA synthetase